MNVLNELTARGNAAANRKGRIARRGATLGAITLVVAQALVMTPAAARTSHALYEQDDVINFSGSFLAAQQASRNHDIEAAATYYRNALVADPQNPILIQSAFQLLLADGRIKDALPLAERILARDKNNHLARLTLGIEAFKRGNFERARAHFAQMQPRGDANVPATILELTATILAGWAYEGQNDPDTALKVIDRLKGPDWYDVFKNYHTGLIDEMAGRKLDAAKRIGEAYKADSTGLRIIDADARNLARQGKKDEALAVLDAFDKQTPDHPLVKALRADIANGVVPQPLIQSASSGAAELLFGIGAAIGREGGEEIAAVYLQLALWLDPKSELALITLASVQGQLKQYDKAVSLLEQVPPNSRLKPMVDIQISRYYNVLEKYDKAKDRLSGLVKTNPKDIDAVMALGDVYRATKDFGEAAKVYTQAIDNLPKPSAADWSLFYYRGISFERTKQWPKAEADLFKAIDLNPKEPHVLNYLGYSWIDMGISLDKGLDLVKKAVALAPDDGYIVDSLGWAYYRLGRYEESMRELERAIQLKPEDPVINDHLGDAYWRVGRKLEATFQWAHARDMKPEPEDLAKILDKLKNGIKDEAGPKTAATSQVPAAAPTDAPKPAPAPSADTPQPDQPKSVTPTTPAAPLPGTTPKPEVEVPGATPKPATPAPAAPTVAPAPDAPAKSTEPAPATTPTPAAPAPTVPTDLAPPKPEVPAKPEATPPPAGDKPAPQLNTAPGAVPKVKSPIPEVTPDNTPTPTPPATPAKP